MDGLRSIGLKKGADHPVKSRDVIAKKPSYSSTSPNDELVKSLKDQNADLQRQVAELKKKLTAAENPKKQDDKGKIEFDLETSTFTASNLKTKDLEMERLKVEIQDGNKILEGILSPENLAQSMGALPLGSLLQIGQKPMKVKDFKMRLPERTSTRYFLTNKADVLKKEGVSDMQFEFRPGNRVDVTGVAKKIIPVPFRIKAGIGLTKDNRIKIDMENMRVMGIIKVPNLVKRIVMALMDSSVTDDDLQRKGSSYIVNPQGFLPKNIDFQLNKIHTERGAIVLEGGPKDRKEQPGRPYRKSNAPKTLFME